MPVPPGKKLLGASKDFSVNPCRIKSANEFAPTEKSDFTQTGYTRMFYMEIYIEILIKCETFSFVKLDVKVECFSQSLYSRSLLTFFS